MEKRFILEHVEHGVPIHIVAGDDAPEGLVLLGPQPGPPLGALPAAPLLVVEVDLVMAVRLGGSSYLNSPLMERSAMMDSKTNSTRGQAWIMLCTQLETPPTA